MIKLAEVTSVSTCGPAKVEVIQVEPDQWLPRSALPPQDFSRLSFLDGGSDQSVYVPIVESASTSPHRTWIPEAALTYLEAQKK